MNKTDYNQPSIGDVYLVLRGYSAFWFKYKKDDRTGARFIWYNLYLPEGEPLTKPITID